MGRLFRCDRKLFRNLPRYLHLRRLSFFVLLRMMGVIRSCRGPIRFHRPSVVPLGTALWADPEASAPIGGRSLSRVRDWGKFEAASLLQ